MRKLLYVLLFFTASCAAQSNIKKTAGINYTRQAPTYIPSESSGSEIAIDTITGYIWQWHRTPGPTVLGDWLRIGQGIDVTTGGTPPAYAPFRNQSWFAINGSDELYHYSGTGTTWNLVSGGGGGGGTWGSITGTLSDQTDLQAELDTKLEVEVDGSTTNELQNLSLSGQALSLSGGTGATLPIVGVTAGRGVTVSTTAGNATVAVDTALVPTLYGTQSVYKLWPKGTVNSYQNSTAKRNWIINYNNIQSTSTKNAFTKFDTISSILSNTTNALGNGIWLATSTASADMLSGFSNNINHGGGFNLFGSGQINFSDWKASGTRGSILKALNWSDGSGDAAVSFFKSYTADVTGGLAKLPPGEEIGAIRFAAADTVRALTSSKTFTYPAPSAAIVGYVYGTQFNNAHYGGVGIWTTNGSLTQVRAVAIDSTFSTTVRAGVNVVPDRANTLQVNGKTLIDGNLVLNTAGNKLSVATGTNASAGTATLVGGTVTVSTTAVTANSIIIAVCKTPIVTQGILSVPAANIVPGTSFKINSSSVADASTLAWWIIN